MQAERKDLATLLQLQQIDLDLMRSKKKLEELPQRKKILALRQKKQAIEAKQSQIDEMLKNTEAEISRINDEDERLVKKQGEVQEKIDAVRGDYRAVEAHTKELGGIAKRRNTLETDLAPLNEKLNEIEQVRKQVLDALSQINEQEAKEIASFQKEGGDLTNQVAKLQAGRDAAFASLSPEIADLYEKKSLRGGGVAVTRLTGNLCSVCRNAIDEGKLLQVQSEAPLSECPSCKRMMVVIDA